MLYWSNKTTRLRWCAIMWFPQQRPLLKPWQINIYTLLPSHFHQTIFFSTEKLSLATTELTSGMRFANHDFKGFFRWKKDQTTCAIYNCGFKMDLCTFRCRKAFDEMTFTPERLELSILCLSLSKTNIKLSHFCSEDRIKRARSFIKTVHNFFGWLSSRPNKRHLSHNLGGGNKTKWGNIKVITHKFTKTK